MSRAKCELLILCQEGSHKFLKVSAQNETRGRLTALNWFFHNKTKFKSKGDDEEEEGGELIPDDRKEHLEEFIKRKTGRKSAGGKRSNVVKVEERKITDFFKG